MNLALSQTRNEDFSPKPSPCSSYSRHRPVQREVWCEHYDSCLDHAIEENWESFACTDCKSFRSAPMTTTCLDHEADRCRALIAMLSDEKIGGRYFRRMTGYFKGMRLTEQEEIFA
ncbi:MAG: hypothetical protein WCA08_18035 [Desulfoferrobacter sp.]